MPKKGKKLKKENEPTKESERGWIGGLPLPLDKAKEGDKTLREKLVHEISTWLPQQLANQEKLIANIDKWRKQYKGQKDEKTFPFENCSNMAIPATRENTDAILVRLMDAIFGQIKMWIIKPKKEELIDLAPQLEEALDWWQKNIVKLKDKLLSPMLQALKTGTGLVKFSYEREKRTVIRRADENEINDKNIYKYKLPNGEYAVKEVQSEYDGPDIDPLPREDWIMDSDAEDIQKSWICGFRTYIREADKKLKVKQGLYDEVEADKLVQPDQIDETKKKRAEEQGKRIEDSEAKKFEIWEFWMRYDVDDDGEEDDIVVTYHKATQTILRAIYNPMFSGFRPFVAFKGYPSEYCFEGEGICEIGEKIQRGIDSMHNQRFDRVTQINEPMYVVKQGCGIDDFKLNPGKVWRTYDRPGDVVEELKFADTTVSTVNEEQMLVNYFRSAVGITPSVLGQSTAERPVARDTLQLIEESNKKFKYLIDNYRHAFQQIGWMALELIAQHQPKYTYRKSNPKKAGGIEIDYQEAQVVNFPLLYLKDGIEVELTASSERLNTEVRREIAMVLYNLVKDYWTTLGGMAQAMVSPEVHPSFKAVMVRSSQVGEKLFEQLLRDFNVLDADDLVASLEDVMPVQQLMQMPYMPPQQEGQQQGQQPPQGGMRVG